MHLHNRLRERAKAQKQRRCSGMGWLRGNAMTCLSSILGETPCNRSRAERLFSQLAGWPRTLPELATHRTLPVFPSKTKQTQTSRPKNFDPVGL